MIVLGDCLTYVVSVCKWQHMRGGISKMSSSLLQRGLSYHTRERSDGLKRLLHILTLTWLPLPALTHRPHSHRIFAHALFNLEKKITQWGDYGCSENSQPKATAQKEPWWGKIRARGLERWLSGWVLTVLPEGQGSITSTHRPTHHHL